MASYSKKEISEWNVSDLSSWLLANNFRGISELFQKYSISGYDLFYINDDILKNELNLKSFHERKVALKLVKKLTYEHLKLNVINANGDNVVLTLDNNPETKLSEISDYIGNMFNISPKDILFKDSTRQEVLSPTVKIVQLLILYPKIYKTLNVSNIKDYRQAEDELMESGSGELPENNENMGYNMNMNNNNNFKGKESEMGMGSMSGMMASDEMDYQEMDKNMYNNKYNNNAKIGNNNMNYNKNYGKMNQNQRQNDNNNMDDNYLLNSGSVEDYVDPPQNRKMNYRNENVDINERRNKSYKYNQRNNDGMMDYNEGNNFGMASSTNNDEEMRFKPSYQMNNNENNKYRND